MKKKLLALLLSAAMLFSLTGCLGNLYDRVLTIDGRDIGPGLYLLMLMQAYTAAESEIENQWAAEFEGADEDDIDTRSIDDINVLKQKIEGQNATSWIRTKAEEYARRYVAVEKLSKEYGAKLSEEAWSEIESTLSYWSYFEDYYVEQGVSYDTWRYNIENGYMEEALFQTLYGEDGEMAYPEEISKAAYEQDYMHIRYFTIPTSAVAEGDEEEAPDVTEAATAMIEEMLAELEGGTSFEELATDYLPKVYALENREFDAEAPTDYIYTTYIGYESEYYEQEWLDEMNAAAIGDMGLYDNGNNYLMLYEKIEMFEDDEQWQAQQNTVLKHLYGDEFEEWLTGIYLGYSIDKAFGAEWYYSPKKVA